MNSLSGDPPGAITLLRISLIVLFSLLLAFFNGCQEKHGGSSGRSGQPESGDTVATESSTQVSDSIRQLDVGVANVVGHDTTLVGILYVTGNEPFTRLSLQTQNGRMYGFQDDSTGIMIALRKLQGRRVEVRGKDIPTNASYPLLKLVDYKVLDED